MQKVLLSLLLLIGLLKVLLNDSTPDVAAAPPDPHAGMRGACKQFIERQQLEAANAVWGDWSNWTIVENGDGTATVGAKYAIGDRTRYSSCIIAREGDQLRLVKITRLQ